MLEYQKVLLATGDERQLQTVLQEALSEHAILAFARTLSELQNSLENVSYDTVLCAWSFPEGWNQVVKEVQQRYPELPVIILSRTGGEAEWVKVLEAGAFDLISGPLRRSSILAVLEQAAASCKARALRNSMHEKVS